MTAQAGDTSNLKQMLRRQVRARRLAVGAVDARRAAQASAHHALRLLSSRAPRCVALYLAHGSELSTLPLIAALRARGIAIALPCVDGDGRMHFECWPATMPLRHKRYGIREPALRGVRLLRHQIDVVMLPLLGFDRHGTRLGSGGGYYDRWLARPRAARKPLLLGYAYAVQQLPLIPRERWDVALDAVVTEKGWLWPTG